MTNAAATATIPNGTATAKPMTFATVVMSLKRSTTSGCPAALRKDPLKAWTLRTGPMRNSTEATAALGPHPPPKTTSTSSGATAAMPM